MEKIQVGGMLDLNHIYIIYIYIFNLQYVQMHIYREIIYYDDKSLHSPGITVCEMTAGC